MHQKRWSGINRRITVCVDSYENGVLKGRYYNICREMGYFESLMQLLLAMKKNVHRKITDLLALLVFGVFAVCVVATLLTGARIYKNLTLRGTSAYEYRVAVRYLTTRFHQAPVVWVEDFCGIPAMTVREEFRGKTYLTRIYCHNGYIRELFAAAGAELTPNDGETIMEAERLTFSVNGSMLSVQITHTDGGTQQIWLHLPAEKGDVL